MLAGLAGDAAAHATLLRALLGPLRGYFSRRLGGRDVDVEDLVQETLIAVHQRRATYDPDRPLGAWVYAIARYKLIDRYRRSGRTTPIDTMSELADEFDFAETSDARSDIARLLDTIPDKQATVLRATRIDGLSTAEAAEKLGLGEIDVKVSAHRGLKALAMWLGKSWTICARNVFLLALPIFAGLLWSFRRLAPTKLALAGTSAGLAAGTWGATLCPETSALFVLTWYSLGMLGAALVGWLLGPRLMRW